MSDMPGTRQITYGTSPGVSIKFNKYFELGEDIEIVETHRDTGGHSEMWSIYNVHSFRIFREKLERTKRHN